MENFPKDLVLAGHVRMREKLAIIREHNLRKNNVLKASLAITRTAPSCAEDVDINDLLKAANGDREKGWNSYQVIQVSCVLLVAPARLWLLRLLLRSGPTPGRVGPGPRMGPPPASPAAAPSTVLIYLPS